MLPRPEPEEEARAGRDWAAQQQRALVWITGVLGVGLGSATS